LNWLRPKPGVTIKYLGHKVPREEKRKLEKEEILHWKFVQLLI